MEAESKADSATTAINKIEAKGTGYINTYNDSGHSAGISFSAMSGVSVPAIVIDGSKMDVIPNNKSSTGNYKIIDMKISISGSNWYLVIQVYVDGNTYTRQVLLS